MSMKFFRQTKETKRKLSFFMALAMVISLLPVSPVAKAEEKEANVTVTCSVTGAKVTSVTSNSAISSGSAIITLAANEGYVFGETKDITVKTTNPNNTTKANNSCTVTAVTATAMANNTKVTTSASISSNKKTYTLIVENISADINVDLSGEAILEDNSGNEGDDKPVNYDVSFDDTGFNYENISLTCDPKLSTGSAINTIPKNTTITFTISAKGEKAKFNVLPVLKSNGTTVDWEGTTTRTATIKVTGKTDISITGGTVVVVAITDANNTTGTTDIPDEALKEDLGEVTISQLPVDDVVTNITTGAITMLDGTNVTPEIVEQILTSLSNADTKVKTSLKIVKASSEDITNANTAISNSSDFGSDANALGENANAIKETVQAMMAREDKVALDITLNSVISMMKNGKVATEASISVKSLGKEIEITMDKPKSLNKDNLEGKYYAIRIHDGEATVLKCEYDKATKKIKFKSNRFSTYVISFVPAEGGDTPATKPPTGGGSGIGSYVPSNSATPAPSATAAPSASPSADPSATPGADSSAAPTESGAPTTGGDTTPTKAPAATDKPVDTDKDNTNGGSTAVKVGKKATVSGSQYKVTAVKGTRTVQFTKGKKNAKSIVVPSTVKISGKNYKVTTIAKNAFKGNKKLAKVTIGKNVNKIGVSAFQNCSKLKSIIIKSTKLTAKKVGKNAFKGINKKATFKVPKSKVKAYKKIVKAKGAGKNVKVKK